MLLYLFLWLVGSKMSLDFGEYKRRWPRKNWFWSNQPHECSTITAWNGRLVGNLGADIIWVLGNWKPLSLSLSLSHLSNKTSIYFNKEQVAYNACLNSWKFLPIWLFRLSHRLQVDTIALPKTMLKLTD